MYPCILVGFMAKMASKRHYIVGFKTRGSCGGKESKDNMTRPKKALNMSLVPFWEVSLKRFFSTFLPSNFGFDFLQFDERAYFSNGW